MLATIHTAVPQSNGNGRFQQPLPTRPAALIVAGRRDTGPSRMHAGFTAGCFLDASWLGSVAEKPLNPRRKPRGTP